MRISSISNYYQCVRPMVKKAVTTPTTDETLSTKNVNFRSLKTKLGGTMGAGIGVVFGLGLAVLTGGVGAVALPIICGGAGAIGGALAPSDPPTPPDFSKEHDGINPDYKDI